MYVGITQEKFDGWMTPSQAVLRLTAAFGKPDLAMVTLLERLRGGMVRSVAGDTKVSDDQGVDHSSRRLSDIPKGHWEHIQWNEGVWLNGDMVFEVIEGPTHSRKRMTVRHYGVRFDPDHVKAILANAPAPGGTNLKATPPSPQKLEPTRKTSPAPNKGGAPRKEWWEDLWVEICRQIHAGELVPKKQVDIENAMHEWLALKEHEASERTIRDRARKLFESLDLGGQ